MKAGYTNTKSRFQATLFRFLLALEARFTSSSFSSLGDLLLLLPWRAHKTHKRFFTSHIYTIPLQKGFTITITTNMTPVNIIIHHRHHTVHSSKTCTYAPEMDIRHETFRDGVLCASHPLQGGVSIKMTLFFLFFLFFFFHFFFLLQKTLDTKAQPASVLSSPSF